MGKGGRDGENGFESKKKIKLDGCPLSHFLKSLHVKVSWRPEDPEEEV